MAAADREKLLLFLDCCALIEHKCADMYHYYSELFNDTPEMARLWKKTALEEENHARQVRLAIRMIDEIATFPADASLDKVYRVNRTLDALLAGVKQSPPSRTTALRKAIETEQHLAGLHVDHALMFRDPSTNQMFKALHDADQGHITELQKQLAIETIAHAEMCG